MAYNDLGATIGASFGLEIDGIIIRDIKEVSGFKLEQDVIEDKKNLPGNKYVVKKLPGNVKSGEVTLTRGLDGGNSFSAWKKSAGLGDMSSAAKSGAIIIYDSNNNVVKRFTIDGAWSTGLSWSSLKAGGTEALTEKLTIKYNTGDVDLTPGGAGTR